MHKQQPGSPVDAGPLHIQTIRVALNGAYRFSKRLAGQWCYRVLAKPPRKELTHSEIAFLAEAEQSILPVGIMQIRTYHWPGKGARILLAHGWNSHSGRWQVLVQRLQKAGFDVYAVDAPAHGGSYGGSFAVVYYGEVLAAMAKEISPAVIIGHSAGGMAAAYYLRHFPNVHRPEKLALLATPAELNHFMESFRRVIGIKEGVIKAMESIFLKRFGKAFDYFAISRFVREFQIPGLIIHDNTDDIAPVHGAYELAENWKGSELLITQGLGHSVQDEKVREQIMKWLG